jgi:hypothetical protein
VLAFSSTQREDNNTGVAQWQLSAQSGMERYSIWSDENATADLSASLRSGRDDTFVLR